MEHRTAIAMRLAACVAATTLVVTACSSSGSNTPDSTPAPTSQTPAAGIAERVHGGSEPVRHQ